MTIHRSAGADPPRASRPDRRAQLFAGGKQKAAPEKACGRRHEGARHQKSASRQAVAGPGGAAAAAAPPASRHSSRRHAPRTAPRWPVVGVLPSSRAETLRLQPGDELAALSGAAVASRQEADGALRSWTPGTRLSAVVRRDLQTVSLRAPSRSRPRPSRAAPPPPSAQEA